MSEARETTRAACIERAGRALAAAHERIVTDRASASEREHSEAEHPAAA